METKSPENSGNNFSQADNDTSREYIFAPVSYRVKIIILTCMLSFGVYGLIANSLILYFKQKRQRRTRNTIQRSSNRPLTEYFVQSICLTDILCSLTSLPLYSTEMFIDFVDKDWICRFTRFLLTIFPVVTILNLLVIGVERYLAIFHPFVSLSRTKAKKMVVGAWVFGALISSMASVYVTLVNHDVGEDFYTLVCKYDSSVPLYRNFFTGFLFISYVIPSFTLTIINFRILKRQRSSQHVDASQTTQRAVARLKVTRIFVSLIFAFIIPYMTFFVYSSFKTAFNYNVSFTNDYVVRHISVFLAYANGSVSATILIYYENLYLDFLSCFRLRSKTGNDQSRSQSNKGVPDKDAIENKNSSV